MAEKNKKRTLVIFHGRIFNDQRDYIKKTSEETGETENSVHRRAVDIGIKELKQNGEK